MPFLYTGKTPWQANYVHEMLEWLVRPKGIVNEGTWCGSTLDLAVNIATNPTNSLLVALVEIYYSSPVMPTSLTWNGKTLTRQVSTTDLYTGSAIYTLVNPGAGNSSVTGSASYVAAYMTVVLLSGVNQSMPVISTGSATTQGTKTINLTTEAYGMSLEGGIAGHDSNCSTGMSASPPQTKITSSLDYASSKENIGTTDSMTRTLILSGTDPCASMTAIALKPA